LNCEIHPSCTEAQALGSTEYGQGVTTNLIVVPLLLKHLVRESIKQVAAFIHHFSKHLKLPKHRFVCDVPSLGLFHGGLDAQQDMAQLQQVDLHALLLPETSIDDERY
jgi:hypothetical protein